MHNGDSVINCSTCKREIPEHRECPVHGAGYSAIVSKMKKILFSGIGGAALAVVGMFALKAQVRPDAVKDFQIVELQIQHVFDQAQAAVNPLLKQRADICQGAGFATPPGCNVVDGKLKAAPQPTTAPVPADKK